MSKSPQKNVRIYIVDDSEDDLLMMKEAITLSPPLILAESFTDGPSLMEHLVEIKDFNDLPSIIFLDINLPIMNGFEILEALKEHSVLCAVPVILFTTSNREEDILNAYQRGACSYVQKPFGFDDLVMTIQKIAAFCTRISLPKYASTPS